MKFESRSIAIEHASQAAAVEHAADGIIVTDIRGMIKYVNPAFTAMTGYSSEEIVGQSPRILKSGLQPQAFYKDLWDTIRSGKVWQGELINRRKDGSVFHEESRISPVLDSNGEIAGFVAIKRDVTELRAARETQALLAAIVESSEDSIMAYSPDGIIRSFNRGAETIFGFSSSEVIGRHISMLVPPDRLAALEELMRKLLRGEGFTQYEGICLRKDGRRIQVSVTGFPIKNSDGEVIGLSNILRDITLWKQLERQLHESEERFRGIFENAPIGMYVAGPDGRLMQANKAACRMLGYSEQEMLCKSWPDFGHPEDMAEALQRMRQLRDCGAEVAGGERRFFHRNGTVIWCQVTISLLQSSEGDTPNFVVHLEDITERRQAKEALRESEERFRTMADGSPSMMWVTDSEGRIGFLNRPLRKFYGIEGEEWNGIHWDIPIHPEDMPRTQALFVQAMSERKPIKGESRVRRADGEWRLMGTTAEPRLSPVGQYLGHIGVCADITDRVRAEQARQFQHSLIRTIHDVSLDGILVVNGDGRIVSFNKKCFEMWNIPLSEALDRPFDTGMEALDFPLLSRCTNLVKNPDSFLKRVKELYADPDANDQCEIELKDGRTLERYSTTLRDENGRYLARAWFFRDITERKSAELARQFQLSLIRAIYEVSPDGILVVNENGEIGSHNQKFFDTWRIPATEIVGTVQSPLEGSPIQPLLQAGLARVLHPEKFLLGLRELYADPSAIDNCEIEMKDGRTLERYSTSLRNEKGGYLARVLFYRDITERKRAELVLKESEERFRVMADGCPIGIWVTDPQGRTRFVNRTYREFCGIASETVDADTWINFFHPDDGSVFVAALDRALQQHTPFRLEHRSRRADGEWRWVESYAEPRFSANKEFLGFTGTSQDVTERRLAELALKESEEKFRELAENIREVFWMMNAEGTEMLYIGTAYEQIWGRTCESLYQNPMAWMEAIHPDDRTHAHDTFLRQLQGESIDSEYRISTPDGQERWIRDRAFPVRNSTGQLTRVAGIAEDVTRQKRYEEDLIRAREAAEDANRRLAAQHAALDNERKILRAFIDNVPEFMYVKDLESRFVIANNAVVQWAGVEKPEDLIGKTDFDFCPRELAAEFFEDEQRVIRTRQPMIDREQTSSIDAMHEVRYSLTTKVPLFDSAGQVTGIAGVGRDITMRRAMEDAARESNRELEEATDWANKLALEAEAANRSKSEFLANMSHEIRTPMNGVLGMNSLLLSSDLNKEQRHYAEVVDASARSLLTVIDDILDFSKVEAGKLEIDSVDFNLHVMMDEFAEMMAERAAEKQLEFICAVAPEVTANLRGDPGRLRQVLLNLASNAMKFTHQGEVAVRVSLISETDAEVSLRFVVRDTGIGIPAEKQQLLFTSFTQVDASTTRKYGGTGLGLAISKKLVELMGGKIGLESKEGEGSEFWFTLPLARQPAGRHVNSPKVSLRGKRVLTVDDNTTNREVLTAQLRSWGAMVAAVESGATALVSLHQAVETGNPFDLAILDMMMPGMDGAALGRAILADDTLKEIPLVMMTSLGERGDAIRFKEIGFAAYLTKPVRQSDLYDCLVTVLNGGKQREKRALITRHNLHAARRGNVRILLVEDNLTNQEVAHGMLQRLGWHANVTANGKEAIEALEKNSYDLVLMDVQMPEMDGYEATRMIRDSQSAVLDHNIPIIATTAHAMQGDIEKCLAAGMSDYLSKPIDPKKLVKVVEMWLTRKVHRAPGQVPVVPIDPIEQAMSSDAASSGPAVLSSVFNCRTFLERMMGDEEFAHDVVTGFVEELPALLSTLREQFARGDLESIWKQAHKIKGSAANVGADALRDAAFELEQAGKARDLSRVAELIPELEEQTVRAHEALQQWATERRRPV
jgi:PAS domain S-box-containing protein